LVHTTCKYVGTHHSHSSVQALPSLQRVATQASPLIQQLHQRYRKNNFLVCFASQIFSEIKQVPLPLANVSLPTTAQIAKHGPQTGMLHSCPPSHCFLRVPEATKRRLPPIRVLSYYTGTEERLTPAQAAARKSAENVLKSTAGPQQAYTPHTHGNTASRHSIVIAQENYTRKLAMCC
jgi:hypothetical protein